MDYRNSRYCPALKGIESRKRNVADLVKADHPRARDMHAYISKNDAMYKNEFIKAYNGKCAYCGASNMFIPRRSFEIDHFLYKESERFKRKADAGYIENLVLSCNYCNNKKKDFNIPDDYSEKLNPDKEGISRCFVRNDDYYIDIAKEISDDTVVSAFYEQLNLGGELRRLDYLLLNLLGLKNKLSDTEDFGEIYKKIDKMTMLLTQKRNMS